MKSDSLLMRDINRLEASLFELNPAYEFRMWRKKQGQEYTGALGADVLYWMQYREQLEIELSAQSLITSQLQEQETVQKKTEIQKNAQKQNTQPALSKKQRLWRKFKRDPHALFADSSKPIFRLISKVIPKRKTNG